SGERHASWSSADRRRLRDHVCPRRRRIRPGSGRCRRPGRQRQWRTGQRPRDPSAGGDRPGCFSWPLSENWGSTATQSSTGALRGHSIMAKYEDEDEGGFQERRRPLRRRPRDEDDYDYDDEDLPRIPRPQNWLDRQFSQTSIVLLVLFPLCCGMFALIFGIIG